MFSTKQSHIISWRLHSAQYLPGVHVPSPYNDGVQVVVVFTKSLAVQVTPKLEQSSGLRVSLTQQLATVHVPLSLLSSKHNQRNEKIQCKRVKSKRLIVLCILTPF